MIAVLALGVVRSPASAADLLTGAIPLNPTAASVSDQNLLIGQLKAAGVRTICVALTDDTVRIAFAKRAYDQGITIEALVERQFRTREMGPNSVLANWGNLPLASIDPVLSKSSFHNMLDKLEADGVVLAGLELGNEINWTGINPVFPAGAYGKIFNFDDLHTDPRAAQLAAGLRQYVKVLAVLKDVRDRSALNRNTPIISAGLSTVGPAGTQSDFFTQHGYALTISAALTFVRENGLDRIVDGYGIHYYPDANSTADGRQRRMDAFAVSQCRAPGASVGKPCWMTEWGSAIATCLAR